MTSRRRAIGMRDVDTGLECCFLVPFLTVWLLIMASFLKFYWLDLPQALERWAQEEGHRIIRKELRTWFRGPFSRNTRNTQLVYRLELHDRDGLARTAWIRIGNQWWYSTDHIEVRWDDARLSGPDGGSGDSPGSPEMWDRELDA